MFFDPIYLLVAAPAMLLSLWASWQVKSTFNKYHQVGARSGVSGAQAASRLLAAKGINDVKIEETPGFLSDHYDPSAKALRLSPDVFHGRSLSALGVAAHEAGHAIQHATAYGPLAFRSMVAKPAQIGSTIGPYLLMAGAGLHMSGLLMAGVVLFGLATLFTLVTLPVEFDASRRAVVALQQAGIVGSDEAEDTWKVLRAAALTYVAAAITAVSMLLYYLWRAGLLGGRSDDR